MANLKKAVPNKADKIQFTVRISEKVYGRLRRRVFEKGSTFQRELESALNILMAEDQPEARRKAQNPLGDVKINELELLQDFLSLLREGPDDVKTIARAAVNHWRAMR